MSAINNYFSIKTGTETVAVTRFFFSSHGWPESAERVTHGSNSADGHVYCSYIYNL